MTLARQSGAPNRVSRVSGPMSAAELPIRVVVPTFNEADNLEPLLAAVLAAAPSGTGILVVDDASPDGTGEIADRLAADDERISVLHRAGKEGLGPAYVAGLSWALHLPGETVGLDSGPAHRERCLEALALAKV